MMDWQKTAVNKTELVIRSGETALKAFLARPVEDTVRPAIVVIHEIFGLTDHIKDVSCHLAEEGYAALALDLFSTGNMAVCIWKCMSAIQSGKTDHFAVHYLQSALDYLAAQPYVDAGRLGAIGFCMGGNFAISLACQDKRIKTIAPFYGLTPSELQTDNLCPVVGSYPERDLTRKEGEKLKAAMDQTDIPHDIKIYPASLHSYMNDRISFLYNDAAAQDSWYRVLQFFDQHLCHSPVVV